MTPEQILARPWRTGRKVGRTIYVMAGLLASDDDELIGVMDDSTVAIAVVYAHNMDVLRAQERPQ